MLSKVTSRLTYANVMATAAVCIALGGGAYAATSVPQGRAVHAAAAPPKNSVGTAQLKSNAVISSKVKNRSLLAVDFKAGQLPQGPKGDKGDKGDTGTVDTSNFFTKGESDGRYLAAAGTAVNSAQLGGTGPSGFLTSDRLQSSGIVPVPTGPPTTLLTRETVKFTATCTDQGGGDFQIQVFAESTEANSRVGRQADQVDLTPVSTPTLLYDSTALVALLRSDSVVVMTPTKSFYALVARGVNVGGNNCVAGVTATP
jgi:hypothetical protein